VRTAHFANMINEARQQQKTSPVVITVADVPANAFIATVQYLMTAQLTLDSIATAINVIEYALKIECEKCAMAAKSYLEGVVKIYVQQVILI
jgi:hypothetical protein